MTYETEWDQMVHELNEALDIEENASHTQRLFSIVRLRSQALKQRETEAELAEAELKLMAAEQDRDKAEQRLLDVLSAHADFIQDAICQAQVLHSITEAFQKGILGRTASDTMDAAYLAMAQLREEKDDGQRFTLDDVIDELKIAQGDYSPLSKPTEAEVDEGLAPLRAKLYGDTVERQTTEEQAEDDAAPLLERLQKRVVDPETSSVLNISLGSDEVPEHQRIPVDRKMFTEEELAQFREAREQETDTTEHDDAKRTPVPFTEPEDIKLADDTREWLVSMAEGGARDDS